MLAAVLLLSSCAEEAPGPRFANDPAPSRAPTDLVPAGTPAFLPLATPAPVATPSSLADLLSTRGASSRVFVIAGDAVWTIASDGAASRIFDSPAGADIRAIDAAPSAQRVAVLVESRSGARELLTFDVDGEDIGRWSDFGSGPATPVTTRALGTDLVDWSPQGDRILVAFRDGSLFDVPVADGEPTAISIDTGGARIVQPAWSPTGEAIAFIAASDGDRERSLQLYVPGKDEIATVVDPGDDRFVVEFVWMPDGKTLLFTEGGEPGGAVAGIDLWRIHANGEDRRLVASAGTVAPVARIGSIRPSPDGRSVAYSVFLPSDGFPTFDSVWVRDVASGIGYRVPLPTVVTAEDLWWTDRGLVVSVIADGAGRERGPTLALLLVEPGGAVSALWAAPLGGATPVVGTPVATPGNR